MPPAHQAGLTPVTTLSVKLLATGWSAGLAALPPDA
jgi:hypothetical protein